MSNTMTKYEQLKLAWLQPNYDEFRKVCIEYGLEEDELKDFIVTITENPNIWAEVEELT